MVNRELFESFEKALGGNVELMRASFEALPKDIEGLPPSKAKAYLSEAYRSLVREHGGYAAVAAMEFYELARSMSDLPTAYVTSAFVPDDEGLLVYDAREASKAGFEKASQNLFQTGTQRVMEYADETLLQNSEADPAHPRWALVPRAGACGWCQMIASNGFMYSGKGKTENARHPSCRCTPVVDFDAKNPSLEGYDPGELYGRYKAARAKAEEGAWEEWESLPPEKRASYGGKGRGAYDHFLRNRIAASF